ncbi:MAG TPA: flagellar biosynthesis protein FlhA [Bryobacteraceae bacterium]|nr:flagellar biosynthesis protein FlhA [Bryobacteraceae bacterium]
MTKALTQASPLPAGLRDIAVPVAVLGIVLVMIAPIPAFLLDLLISANIMFSVVVLLISLYIRRAVEFNVFPTALLLLTLFRLALNISSSRSILLNGATGTAAAGHVIEAFGNFVVGGNYVIGVVIFLVLIAIQFVVINHGAVRISEVTARFTLDAMPGKQMSIDSDLNAGLIDENEARLRRKQISSEAEFYGAMDGATRFTQRDAIASMLITVINIVAGFLIGVLQHGMDLTKALKTYTVLTIGDGLVTVIPALVISVSGGLIVTRSNSESRLTDTLRSQFMGDAQPLLLASGILAALAALPGMPVLPFLFMSGGTGWIGWRLRQKVAAAEQLPAAEPRVAARENIESLLKVEPLAVEVGLGLVGMVDGGSNSPLLRRITGIRKQLAGELGYTLPAVRVTDNLALGARDYSIKLKGVEIARYELKHGCELAIRPPGSVDDRRAIEGVSTLEPAFGIPAVWVRSEQAELARNAGYTVVDASNIVGTHLMEVIRRHSHELFSRHDAKKFLDRVAEDNPKLVEDLVPKLLSLAVLQRVLQNLLRERVSIRDAVTVLEALGEAGNMTRNPALLTEFVRQALSRAIVQPYLGPKGDLPAFFLDSSIEQAIESSVEHGEHASQLNLAPQRIREILERFAKRAQNLDGPVVAVCSTGARYFLRQLLEPSFRNVFVLSHSEIPPGTKVTSLGLI